MTASIVQTLNKRQQLNNNNNNKKEISFSVIFHRFQPFICCLSVILWLDKGDCPENLHVVSPCYIVCPCGVVLNF